MKYLIKPFPAVRVNWKWWRFQPRAIKYHENIDILRNLIRTCSYTEDEIMDALIQWNYTLTFIFEMPKSWSKKKKLEMIWQPHKQTPDIDNLFKAFTDTVFYKKDKNDCWIHRINARKYWAWESSIIFDMHAKIY